MTAPVYSRRRLLGSALLIGLPIGCRADPPGMITSTDQLDRALANAQPGDEIVLADGTYAAPRAITRGGTASSPIVIRAASLLGARFTSGSIGIDASWITLHGIDHVGSGGVRIGQNAAADDVKIWRCRFRDRTDAPTQAIRTFDAKRTDIAYCEVRNWKGSGVLLGASAGTREPVVRHCLFRDTPAGFEENGTEAIRTLGTRSIDLGALFHRCRISRWTSDGECLKLSSSSCIVRQCVTESSTHLNNRGGQNNLFDACWTRGSWGIGVHDGYLPDRVNKVLGCRTENARDGIYVRGGNVEPGVNAVPGGASNWNLAEGCVVAGCEGHVKIAHLYPGHTGKARYTRLRQHTGTVDINSGATDTDDGRNLAETLYVWSPSVWLTDNDVGPFADLSAAT